MLISLMALVSLSLFVFYNSIYYCFCLILLVTLSLVYLCVSFYVKRLLVIIMLIVYSGAVMVLIGYVSAVSPNFLFFTSHSFLKYLFLVLVSFIFSFLIGFVFPVFPVFSLSLVDFFYSPVGFSVLFTLLYSLFITLLIVTSQHLCPNGPFRSSA